MFQIIMTLKMLINHSLNQRPVNIHRNKSTNYVTVKISFKSTELNKQNRYNPSLEEFTNPTGM